MVILIFAWFGEDAIGGVPSEFGHEGRWPRVRSEDRERLPGSGHRDVHDAALFSIWERLFLRGNQGQKRVIDYLGRESHSPTIGIQQDHMIRFQAFGGMDGLEADLQPREPLAEHVDQGRHKVVSAEEEHHGGSPIGWQRRGNLLSDSRELRLILVPRNGKDSDCRLSRDPGRDDLLLYLCWVLKNESPGGKGDLVNRAEGSPEIDRPVQTRIAIEASPKATEGLSFAGVDVKAVQN